MSDVTLTIPDDVVRWLAFGERGISSETIVSHLTGLPVRNQDHPWDPNDLRRCVLMLDACPSMASRFDEMRTASPTWARLVDAWPELTAKLREEMAAGNLAPETSEMMRELRRGAEAMTGRPKKPPRHWLAQKYAEERAREDAEAAAVQRQHELRKKAAEAQERRRQRAEDLRAEWRCTIAFDREVIVSAMRHDAAALRDEGDTEFVRAHEIAAELLEVMGT